MGANIIFLAALLMSVVSCESSASVSQPHKQISSLALDRQIRRSSSQSKVVLIYGWGSLWYRNTGLPSKPPVARGIAIRNKAILRSLAQYLRCSDRGVLKTSEGNARDPFFSAGISIAFRRDLPPEGDMDGGNSEIDSVDYFYRGKEAYCFAPFMKGNFNHAAHQFTHKEFIMKLLPGNSKRFEAFLRRMIRWAHVRGSGVSVFSYDPYSLSPS